MISGTHGFPDRAGITVSFLILRPHLGAPALTHRIGNKTRAAAIKRPPQRTLPRVATGHLLAGISAGPAFPDMKPIPR